MGVSGLKSYEWGATCGTGYAAAPEKLWDLGLVQCFCRAASTRLGYNEDYSSVYALCFSRNDGTENPKRSETSVALFFIKDASIPAIRALSHSFSHS